METELITFYENSIQSSPILFFLITVDKMKFINAYVAIFYFLLFFF